MVHEKFTGKEVEDIKKENPGIEVIAHPECPPDVISASDFAGWTLISTFSLGTSKNKTATG